LLDDAYEIRSLAASLLECVDSNAELEVEAVANAAADNGSRHRHLDALVAIRAIRVIRAGGTSCR